MNTSTQKQIDAYLQGHGAVASVLRRQRSAHAWRVASVMVFTLCIVSAMWMVITLALDWSWFVTKFVVVSPSIHVLMARGLGLVALVGLAVIVVTRSAQVSGARSIENNSIACEKVILLAKAYDEVDVLRQAILKSGRALVYDDLDEMEALQRLVAKARKNKACQQAHAVNHYFRSL